MGELQQPRNKNDPLLRQTMTANNFKSFANESRSVIRNNLGLCICPEIYLV